MPRSPTGQNVGAVQPEHQEHLGRPAAESLHATPIARRPARPPALELVELQALVGDARAKIAQVADLLSAQADARTLFVS
jgi:hypothetical protein